MVNLKHLI